MLLGASAPLHAKDVMWSITEPGQGAIIIALGRAGVRIFEILFRRLASFLSGISGCCNRTQSNEAEHREGN